MPEVVIHTADFDEGYQITSTSGGLRVKQIRQHPEPLTISREDLAKFGLQFIDDHHIPLNAQAELNGVLDRILASLNRAIEMMGSQADKERKWDIDNLRRAMILLGGLDEEVVERILRGEGL
jgi:hypothetical protein